MIMSDARVPVVFAPVEAAGPDDAVLREGKDFTPESEHAPGCACCAGRTHAGRALATLLHARARTQVAFFRRVVVVIASEEGRAAVESALANDPVASTCFRKEGVLF
jgi:hypothetical protein